MTDPFVLKLLISFLVGGSWVLLSTILADKLGTKIGGLINGLPSIVLFGLLFIAWTQSTEAAVSAATIIPAIGGIGTLLMASYIYFVRINLWLALIISISLWLSLSLLLVLTGFNNFMLSWLIYICLLSLSYFFVEHILHTKSVEGKKIKYTFSLLLLRGLLSGFIIAFAVFIAKVGGPVLGGVFSVFPAATVSTMIISYKTHGAEFSAGMVKSALVGAITVMLYATLVRFSYLSLGVILGTVVSILGSFFSGYLIYQLIIKKNR